MNTRQWFVLILTVGVAMAGPLAAKETENDDETSLQTERQKLDTDTSPDTRKVDALSKQFGVESSVVQDLRTKGQGWGEITIGLATAQELSKKDPATYPTLTDALTKVQSLRAEGAGWGKIAKDLGFKLGPVVSAARHAKNDLRASARKERVSSKMRHEKHEKMEGMEHPVHPVHPVRPEHPGKPEHPNH